MKAFNKNKAKRNINLKQNKNTYIKKLSISLSCLFLLICAILFTFAKFETSSDLYTLIDGRLGEYVNENCSYNEGQVWNFSYTGNFQNFNVSCSGEYKVELWGAQGGSRESDHTGELGGYTSGNINLYSGDNLFVYVGEGEANINTSAFNSTTNSSGGGNPGGGATDVRTISGTWNNEISLRSRIMVAGGGGSSQGGKWGGAAGGLIGYSSSRDGHTNTGGTQVSGGVYYAEALTAYGGFGIGSTIGATGGSGWYGGSGAAHAAGSGAGGSSYISGYTGCVGVTSKNSSSPKSGCTTGTTNNDCSISPFGYVFTNGVMIDGMGCNWSTGSASNCGTNQVQPNGTKAVGHSGHGYARITLISKNSFYKLDNKKDSYVGKEWHYDYTGAVQNFTTPIAGKYKIELWGAQGTGAGGKGGYTSGIINLELNTSLKIYVGGQNSTSDYTVGGYNGGGYGTSYSSSSGYSNAGGGATDVRLIGGTWNNFNSLKSRIMVAAGGAGEHNSTYLTGAIPGYGGGLIGGNAGGTLYKTYAQPTGATQTTGGTGVVNNTYDYDGKFGYALQESPPACWGSGAGGGYYGGWYGCGAAGSGGSSFISGYSGCNAITEASTENNIVHTNQPNHYSGKVFTSGVMIDGAGCNWSSGSAANCGTNQIQPNGTNSEGHSGNGYAKITYISK